MDLQAKQYSVQTVKKTVLNSTFWNGCEIVKSLRVHFCRAYIQVNFRFPRDSFKPSTDTTGAASHLLSLSSVLGGNISI